MRGARCPAIVVLIGLAGCAQAFDLEEVSDPSPMPTDSLVQQLVHTHASTDRDVNATYPIPVPQTTAGSTLVAIMGISTATQQIAAMSDDAGNTWFLAVNGPEATDTSLNGRIAIWYAPAAMPITEIRITAAKDRHIATSFSEWSLGDGTAVGARATPYHVSELFQSTGPLDVASPALVIAGLVRDGGNITATTAPGFSPLAPFAASDIIGTANYQLAEPGTFEVSWTFDEAILSTGAIIAFRR